MIPRFSLRFIAYAGALLLVFALISITVRSCGAARQSSADARQATSEGKAVSGSIKDAASAVAAAERRSDALDKQVMEAIDEINQASNVNDITGIGAERVREHRDRSRKP